MAVAGGIAVLVGGFSMRVGGPPPAGGHGHESRAVTWNLAQGRPPALTPAEWERFSRLLAADFGGAPPLVGGIPGGDGRVDVLHFWLYPALAVPPPAALRAP